MPRDRRFFVVFPLAIGFAACGVSGIGGGTSTSGSGAGGGPTAGSASAGGAGTGGALSTTSAVSAGGGTTSAAGTGGVAMAGSSGAGGAGTGGALSTTTAGATTTAGSVGGAGGAPMTGSSSVSGAGVGGATSTSTASVGASASASTTTSTGGLICRADSDCPGISASCMGPVCLDGICGTGIVPAGMDALTQTPGDCQKDQCDAQGNVIVAPDPMDIPVAGNQCMAGSCVGGVPTFAPATGTACNQNGGKVCDSGTCVECAGPSDCAPVNDCNVTGCAQGHCYSFFTDSLCNSPPPCHEGPALCDPVGGCSYASYKGTGSACPGGVCDFGVCLTCAQWCSPPLPCQLLVCDSSGPVVACTYPSAPQGTSCPGGTCDGSGACL